MKMDVHLGHLVRTRLAWYRKPKTPWADSINRFLTSHTLTRYEDNDWMKIARDSDRWSNLMVEFVNFNDLPQP